jgi:hypothetical protein
MLEEHAFRVSNFEERLGSLKSSANNDPESLKTHTNVYLFAVFHFFASLRNIALKRMELTIKRLSFDKPEGMEALCHCLESISDRYDEQRSVEEVLPCIIEFLRDNLTAPSPEHLERFNHIQKASGKLLGPLFAKTCILLSASDSYSKKLEFVNCGLKERMKTLTSDVAVESKPNKRRRGAAS